MTGQTMITIAQQIRSARQAAGLSQHQLARAVGVTDRAAARWESGGSTPDIATLRRIAEACGITLSALVAEGNSPEGG